MRRLDRYLTALQCGESARRIGHEAPFQRELPRRCIKLFSFLGDTVFDPFSGSGTTLIEAVKNGRNGLGLELETEYCKLAIGRIRKECGMTLRTSPPERVGRYAGG